MERVQYIVDPERMKTGVVMNLKKRGRLWEDVYDNWLAERREHEPRETFECVRARLERQGNLSA